MVLEVEGHRLTLVQSKARPANSSGHSRRVTGMELFFDLIFAAAVAQVGTPLSMDYSASGLPRYVFLFVLIWLAWSGLNNVLLHPLDSTNLVQRLLVLPQSFIAAVMAANARMLGQHVVGRIRRSLCGYANCPCGTVLARTSSAETRGLTTRFAAGYSIAAMFWIASAVSPLPARYVVWAIALIADLATPWFARKHSLRHPPDAAHYPERFGLFTIILLGEFVAAVMRGIESQEYWSLAAASTAFTSMAFGFAIWWWYFDGARSSAERHLKTRRQAALFHVWNYAHLPLFLGIGVAGAGFHHAISVQPGSPLAHSECRVLCAAVALLMSALIVIGATTEAPKARLILQTVCLAWW